MKLKIRGGIPLKGAIDIPADKSLTHRGLMFGALGNRSLTVKALGERLLLQAPQGFHKREGISGRYQKS